jgi:hypothetical protein
MSKRSLRQKKCAYCGVNAAETKDHVIPKCLFPDPLPWMVTVPACRLCNEAKSKNDTYLRDMLAFDINCGEHPAANALMQGKITRAMRGNKSEFARQLVGNNRRVELRTPTGLYVGYGYSVPLDVGRVNEIFTTIARGVYYQLAGQRFPDGYRFEVRRIMPRHADLVFNTLKEAGLRGPYRLGAVFGCLFAFWTRDPGVATWLMWFYDSFFIRISSSPAKSTGRNGADENDRVS